MHTAKDGCLILGPNENYCQYANVIKP
jgi:hypothetical protein